MFARPVRLCRPGLLYVSTLCVYACAACVAPLWAMLFVVAAIPTRGQLRLLSQLQTSPSDIQSHYVGYTTC